MDFEWIAFCSQTGSEIMNLSENIGRVPEIIVTNNPKTLSEGVYRWICSNNIVLRTIPLRPNLNDYSFLKTLNSPLITLHGYTRIVPKEVVEEFKIFNGHPGLITEYPELKGFNPQEKAFKLGMKRVGSVIHKVSEGVDEGEVLYKEEGEIELNNSSVDDYYSLLRKLSLKTWVAFFKLKLYNK